MSTALPGVDTVTMDSRKVTKPAQLGVVKRPPIFALIIGNNDYPYRTSLHFAARDADAIEGFFKEYMNLSGSNLISKRNATREQMLEGFRDLEEKTGSSVDPIIIIFYAGHGARTQRPEGWEQYTVDDDMIEMLCPSDIGGLGKDGKVIEGIPDRLVGALLHNLARKSGNNITLILDCCHAAGGDRIADLTPRCLHDPPPITAEANVIPPLASGDAARGLMVTPDFQAHSASSHVLLAACGKYASAFESFHIEHGLFTHALLASLESMVKTLEKETYSSLIRSLNMPACQVPHCMGVNQGRPLFNPRGNRFDPSYILCKSEKTQGPRKDGAEEVFYRLLAGEVEGVLVGDEFDAYDCSPFQGQEPSKDAFCKMTAVKVGYTSSLLRPLAPVQVGIPDTFYAKNVGQPGASAAHVSIYCADKGLLAEMGASHSLHVVDNPSHASLILTVEGGNVFLDRNDNIINKYIDARLPICLYRDNPKEILGVVHAWQHFNYHLYRQPVGEDKFPGVHVEMHYLEEDDEDLGGEIEGGGCEDRPYRRYGDNLLKPEASVHRFVVSEPPEHLGFTLHNDGKEDVYPYIFYFSPNKLAITLWDLVPAAPGKVGAPLRRGSQLAVGYGNSQVDPIILTLEPGETQDVGFIKLFITSSPANLECMSLESPFVNVERNMMQMRRQRTNVAMNHLSVNKWGAKLFPIVQTRANNFM